MTKLITTKNLFNELTATTTSTSYGAPTWRSLWRWDDDNWDGTVEVYFEAILSHNSGTAYAALYTNAGVVVTGSEVSTTSTSQVRVRSGNIVANLVDDTDYTVRIKASGATATLYNARVIIKQTGTITKKEYYIPVTSGGFGTTSTSLAEQPRSSIINFNPTQWDGTYSVYFEMCSSVTPAGDIGFAALRDMTAAAYVTGSTISSGSTTVARTRSTALTMNSGSAEYRCYYRSNNGLVTQNLSDAYLVVIQSGAPTKGVIHSAIKNMNFATTSTSPSAMSGSNTYWDDDDWDVTSQSVEYETTLLISNAASTATSQVSGFLTSGVVTTSSTTKSRQTVSLNPYDNEDLWVYLQTSNGAHTATQYGPRLVSYVNFAPAFRPKVIMI